MRFDKTNKVIISSLKNREEARAFIIFLRSEITRHDRDIEEAKVLIRDVTHWFGMEDKWEIP